MRRINASSTAVVLGGLVFFLACSTATRGGVEEDEGEQAGASGYVITAEEIVGITAGDALEVVNQLRPQWFRNPRYAPIVYVHGMRQVGGPDALRDVTPTDIQEIRYMPSQEAMFRYGQDHKGGAIVVTIKN